MAAGRARGSRPRRVSLPGVAELLRPAAPGPAAPSGRTASGRESHPQKITVYLSGDEFLDLERARLTLRARGVNVDRGRLVREAIAILLADLDAGVEASLLARRLRSGAGKPPDPGPPAATAPASGVPVNGVPANGTRPGEVPDGGAHADGAHADGAIAGPLPVDVVAAGAVPEDVAPADRAPAAAE